MTPDINALERLTRAVVEARIAHEANPDDEQKLSVLESADDALSRLTHVDGKEEADAILSLIAQVRELREALEPFASMQVADAAPRGRVTAVVSIEDLIRARAALSKSEAGQ